MVFPFKQLASWVAGKRAPDGTTGSTRSTSASSTHATVGDSPRRRYQPWRARPAPEPKGKEEALAVIQTNSYCAALVNFDAVRDEALRESLQNASLVQRRSGYSLVPRGHDAFAAFCEASNEEDRQDARSRVEDHRDSILADLAGARSLFRSRVEPIPQVPPFKGLGPSLRDLIREQISMPNTPSSTSGLPPVIASTTNTDEDGHEYEEVSGFDSSSEFTSSDESEAAELEEWQFWHLLEQGGQGKQEEIHRRIQTEEEADYQDNPYLLAHAGVARTEEFVRPTVYAHVIEIERPSCVPRQLRRSPGSVSRSPSLKSPITPFHIVAEDYLLAHWASDEAGQRLDDIKAYLSLPVDMNPAQLLVYLLTRGKRVRKDMALTNPDLVIAINAIDWDGVKQLLRDNYEPWVVAAKAELTQWLQADSLLFVDLEAEAGPSARLRAPPTQGQRESFGCAVSRFVEDLRAKLILQTRRRRRAAHPAQSRASREADWMPKSRTWIKPTKSNLSLVVASEEV